MLKIPQTLPRVFSVLDAFVALFFLVDDSICTLFL